MTTHFNKLTPAEAERLAYLIEELSEVQQCACKILRHGYSSYNPLRPEDGDNRNQLEREITDVMVAIGRMVAANDLTDSLEDLESKMLASNKYMHHQPAYKVKK